MLIDDLRIIGGTAPLRRDILGRLGAMRKALFNPDSLLTMLKPGWGKSVDLLTVQRLAMDVSNVSFCLLDGHEPKDVLCVFPYELQDMLFKKEMF